MEHRLNDVKIPKFDLKGKTAIITGGTKGLGYATAVAFAHYGANVVVASRNVDNCARVESELKSIGAAALGIPTDVLIQANLDNMVAKTVEKFGGVDIVVACAGIGSTMFAVNMSEEHWDSVVDLDLRGVFFTDKVVAKQMITQGRGGKIINIASAAGIIGSKAMTAYCAAKAGVVQMTKALALELGRDNILVNAICPGYFLTSLNEEQMAIPKVRKAIEDFTIVGRLASFEEITSAIVWLASDCSGYTTGTHILIDGGAAAR
jgi:NAD(P)-dependent dehydrogenase (short-subunit alcohol dehydrogenase family)